MHENGEYDNLWRNKNDDYEFVSKLRELEDKIKQLELKLIIKDKDVELYSLILGLKADNEKLNKIVQNLIVNINERGE